MRKLFFILFLCSLQKVFATNYYMSSSTGNDSNTGTSAIQAWATLGKLNAQPLNPGDRVFFKRGDTFYGSLIISHSGSSGSSNDILYSTYGNGTDPKPIITGFTDVTLWTNLGSNIWESTSAVSTLSYTNMVSINGVNTPMGSWPNYPAYALFNSRSGDNVLISDTLTSVGIDWTGAEVVIANTTYAVTRGVITDEDTSKVTYTKSYAAPITWQSGGEADRSAYNINKYIIQNDPRTLDAQNEWYYNPSTKKLRIYSATTPTNVKIATIDNLLSMSSGYNYITVSNINFQGSNSNCVTFGTQSYIVIDDCDFSFCGVDAIYGGQQGADNNRGNKIMDCSFNTINASAISLGVGHKGLTITGNTIKNCGMNFGMLESGNLTQGAISAKGIAAQIGYNYLDTIGVMGIVYQLDSTNVYNNLVMHSCFRNEYKDGGAIYTWSDSATINKNVTVANNIVITTGSQSQGIYFDNVSKGITAYGNTVMGCKFGMTINGYNFNIYNNTFYDNNEGSVYFRLTGSGGQKVVDSISIHNNIMFAKESHDFAMWAVGDTLTSRRAMISDSNWFAKPIGNTARLFLGYINPPIDATTYYDFTAWKATGFGHDLHSHFSSKTITSTDSLRFEYNATSNPVTISLQPYKYLDAKDNVYDGTITLQPYTSAILIQNGSATPIPPQYPLVKVNGKITFINLN